MVDNSTKMIQVIQMYYENEKKIGFGNRPRQNLTIANCSALADYEKCSFGHFLTEIHHICL